MRKMAASFAALNPSYAPERSGNQAPASFEPTDRADNMNMFEPNGAYGVAVAWIAMYTLVIAVGLLRAIAIG